MKFKNIKADYLQVGEGTVISESAIIRGINGAAKRIVIGDNCYIGENVQIICDNFEIGDYSKIQHDTNVHGYKPCIIGHNAWIGQFTIIDSIGGMTIGNNCGIGAHSQLWSHIKYGDLLAGCRFNGHSKMEIGDDVWFVGHCIVSPIKAESKSMAMVGSVITKTMKSNEIYAGSPAKSISDKIGNQFSEINIEDRASAMRDHLDSFLNSSEISPTTLKIVKSANEFNFEDCVTYFDVNSRTYTKKRSVQEVEFMKYLLPEKAKFIPYENTI